jgi:hypothetical protein
MELVELAKKKIPRGQYVILFGRPAWLLFAALSGRWYLQNPAQAAPELARYCRAFLEHQQRLGGAWLWAHWTVRAAGSVAWPYLAHVLFDGDGYPISDANEYTIRMEL